jgi:hypothetical protein
MQADSYMPSKWLGATLSRASMRKLPLCLHACILDVVPNHHRCSDLLLPGNILLLFLPPYSPEFNPKGRVELIFENAAYFSAGVVAVQNR